MLNGMRATDTGTLGLTIRWSCSLENRVQPRRNARKAILAIAIVAIMLAGGEIVVVSELGSPFPVDVVVSSSMMPTFHVGDLVFVQRVPFNDLHVGDVIVFLQPSSSGGCTMFTVLHRVVAITPQGLITQGDNRTSNPAPDEPSQFPAVTADCVKGKAVFAVPYLGLVALSIPLTGDYLLVVLGILLVVLSELWFRSRRGTDHSKKTAAPLEGVHRRLPADSFCCP